VALCGAYPAYAAAGLGEGILLCLALAGAEAWRAGRTRTALACGVACGLLRVEAWPFLLAAGVVWWRRQEGAATRRPQLAAAAALVLAVPALWLVPEWLGSGDVLRSGARARIPNPGQPALADVPALASLWEAISLPLWPLWIGVAFLAAAPRRNRAALAPAAVGALWIALVAVMAQAGFSGEPRYALPGAALVASSGAIGLAALARAVGRRVASGAGSGFAGRSAPAIAGAMGSGSAARLAAVALLALVAFAAAPRLGDAVDLRDEQEHQRALVADLRSAVATAGGTDGVLRCGRPYAGPYRGPMLAYALGVPKRVVGFAPRAPGVVFRSRLTAGSAPAPDPPPGFASPARNARWEVSASCGS
jgi:hypothetical protein